MSGTRLYAGGTYRLLWLKLSGAVPSGQVGGECHNDRKTPIRVEEMTSASVCQYMLVLAAAFVPLGATEGRAT